MVLIISNYNMSIFKQFVVKGFISFCDQVKYNRYVLIYLICIFFLDCDDVFMFGYFLSGVYRIQFIGFWDFFNVYCDFFQGSLLVI